MSRRKAGAEKTEASRIGDILSSLKSKRKRKSKRPAATHAAEAQATLLQLMNSDESGSVRIAAAKVLLEKWQGTEPESDEARRRETEERAEAVAEARALMAEFAAARLAGLCEPAALDQGGAPATADTAGKLADMADTGGAGLGQDADRG